MFSSVAMAQGLAFGFSTIGLWIVGVFSIVAMLLMIPAIFCIFWLSEIEANLGKRSIGLPTRSRIDERVPGWAMWMMFWGVLAVLLPIVVRYIENKI